MYQVGLSTNPSCMTQELLRDYRASDIAMAELWIAYSESSVDFAQYARDAESAGVKLWSVHLPFDPFEVLDISSVDEQLRRRSVQYLTELIRKATQAGVDKFIVHPSGEPISEEQRSKRMESAKKSLSELAEIAAEHGAVIAVENLPRTCLGRNSDDILELISADDRLRVCFDTNHLLSENPVEFIHKVGKKIITTHVSDYDLVDEKHWLPGEGKTPWQPLLQALQDVGYGGPWLYEVDFEAPKTIQRSRDLTCRDFHRNADELFAGKDLTKIK